MSTTTFQLARLAAVDLVFEGVLLADETTHEPGKARWQEVRIYSTASGKWVVERMGRTTMPGEVDRPLVTVCDTADAVKAALESTHEGRRYTTDVCYDALRAAVDADPRLNDAIVERI